ncbi:MAG: peptidoglycan DD-metalloendopeptidase family protein [Propionibacteriaceae bacterium]|jgi:murein DD-endopeptidase MepM/ murein hydrolase activator NlpD|nr:peptidoglycan DD-metalloendopeptidase family protein [Propionibacteriaceae bacterium]
MRAKVSVIAILTTLALWAGQVGSAVGEGSSSDDLKKAQEKVKSAIVSAKADITETKKEVSTAAGKVKTATSEVKTATGEVKSAATKLAESKSALKLARAKLANLQEKLATAQTQKAEQDAALVDAQAQLEVANAQLQAAIEDVARQQTLLGVAARTVFQQHTDLTRLTFAFTSQDASELSNQLQWSDTIFSSTTAQLERLELARENQVRAQADADAAAVAAAAQAQAAAEKLTEVEGLTAQAAEQQAQVEALVAENKKLKKAAEKELAAADKTLKKAKNSLASAEDELEASKAQYDALQEQEKKIQKELEEAIAKEAAEAAAKAKEGNTEEWSTASSTGFIYPVNAKPGSPFGMRYHPILHYTRMHWGQDFGAKCGAPLYAMADGKVVQTIPTSKSHGLGNWTTINYGKVNGKNIISGYAHQSKIIVKPGQFVKQGEVVGYVGTTGLSTGCHLHLQIYENGNRVNPMKYLK